MKVSEKVNAIIEHFKANPDVFETCIEALDDHTGYLDEFRFHDIGYLIFHIKLAVEMHDDEELHRYLRAIALGSDEDGNRFGVRDAYYQDYYTHLISYRVKDYSMFLNYTLIEQMFIHRLYIHASTYYYSSCNRINEMLADLTDDDFIPETA